MISKDVVLIDGGLSTELEYLGHPVKVITLAILQLENQIIQSIVF